MARSPTKPSSWPTASATPSSSSSTRETITHKTDVGGVRLNLQNADEVRRAYEEMESLDRGELRARGLRRRRRAADGQPRRLRADRREQPGPAVRARAALRLGRLARRGLQGPRPRPPAADHDARPPHDGADPHLRGACAACAAGRRWTSAALEKLLVRFCQLVVEQPWIKELDINPLLASPERLLALDARVVLHDPETREEDLPRTAIRPYPTQYVSPRRAARRHARDDPPDPARGRAADGEVPRDALRRERLHALLPHDEPRPAHGPRAPDAHLLYRLRPRDGPRRRTHGPRDGGTRDHGRLPP